MVGRKLSSLEMDSSQPILCGPEIHFRFYPTIPPSAYQFIFEKRNPLTGPLSYRVYMLNQPNTFNSKSYALSGFIT